MNWKYFEIPFDMADFGIFNSCHHALYLNMQMVDKNSEMKCKGLVQLYLISLSIIFAKLYI